MRKNEILVDLEFCYICLSLKNRFFYKVGVGRYCMYIKYLVNVKNDKFFI